MDFDREFSTMMSNEEKLERAYQKGKWDERKRTLEKLAYQEAKYGKTTKMTARDALRAILGRWR